MKNAGSSPRHEQLSIEGELDKLLRYSDDVSFDRLYDIVGHQRLNEAMAELGFSSVRFHHRLEVAPIWSKRMRRVLLLPPGGGKPVELPERVSTLELAPTPAKRLLLGKAYIGPEGRRVDEPMSFAAKNYVSLRDMQRLHVALLYPGVSRGALELGLTAKQRALVVRAMTGSLQPLARVEVFKPMLPGVLQVLPSERIRYVNKTGIAYGFRLDNAYIEDRATRRGMFVTVAIYTNPNGVLNDDDYDYEGTARPFLRALGEALARGVLQAGP